MFTYLSMLYKQCKNQNINYFIKCVVYIVWPTRDPVNEQAQIIHMAHQADAWCAQGTQLPPLCFCSKQTDSELVISLHLPVTFKGSMS